MWDFEAKLSRCPICAVEYLPTDKFDFWQVGNYLEGEDMGIQFADVMKHSRTLATIARNARQHQSPQPERRTYPPVRALFEALLAAQQFVHFVSYGTSTMFVGALKMVAQRVAVRGLISNADKYAIEELQTYAFEAPKLDVKLFTRGTEPDSWGSAPHQKLIVVDGLLAFSGSANLTVTGWRNAAKGRDSIEVVTDVSKVIDLHNRLFSPIWAEFSAVQQIEMASEKFPF